MTIQESLKKRLDERAQQGLFRSLRPRFENAIDLTSNDYLGFAQNNSLQRAIEAKIKAYGDCVHGATGSRLLTGHQEIYNQTEEKIAQFHQAEAALLFNSGYTANLGLLDALIEPEDALIYDIAIHASFCDGMRLTGVNKIPFYHNDPAHLEKRLKQRTGRKFVCIEAVYSMDGSMAPLPAIADLCERYDAHLIVDEAHAIGIFGPQGRGLVNQFHLEQQVFARIFPFGKAMGIQGAAVVGSSLLREYLINFSRSFGYSTAMPLFGIFAIQAAYEWVEKADLERAKLRTLITHLHQITKEIEIPLLKSMSPIQPLVIPGNEAVMRLSEELAENGFDVRPVRSPTVPRGQEKLRLCLHAFNTKKEIDTFVEYVAQLILEPIS